jgi:hypothetical protein
LRHRRMVLQETSDAKSLSEEVYRTSYEETAAN